MRTNSYNKKSRKQILSTLNYLKRTGISFIITLNYLDETFCTTLQRGIEINLNKIPVGIIFGQTNYSMMIRVDDEERFIEEKRYYLDSYRPTNNQQYIKKINERFGEYIINHKRKTVLDDILGDPNPPTEVPD